jgi:hypothetical protein
MSASALVNVDMAAAVSRARKGIKTYSGCDNMAEHIVFYSRLF